MSAYDLFAVHLMERETARIDLERRRMILDRRANALETDASALSAPTVRGRGAGLRRLLPRSA